MRQVFLMIILMLCHMAWSQDSTEKLSKKEKKELKKQAKAYKSNPERLKALNQEMEALRTEITSLRQDISASNQQVTDLNTQIEELKTQLNEAKRTQTQATAPQTPVKTQATVQKGVIFRVQVGGYKNRDLSEFSDPDQSNVLVETNESGIQEITLGQFETYQKANTFKKHLRAMGLQDAWIVPFKDGQRVLLKDVLDEIDLKNESDN